MTLKSFTQEALNTKMSNLYLMATEEYLLERLPVASVTPKAT